MMAVEAKRGCGYRKVGRLYLCSDTPSFACGRLPLPTDQELTRAFKLLPIRTLLSPSQDKPCQRDYEGQLLEAAPGAVGLTEKGRKAYESAGGCPTRCWVRWPPVHEEEVGFMWVGEKDYTPQSFSQEALTLGLSKRIPGIPKGLQLGKTQVFLAHISVYPYNRCLRCGLDGPPWTKPCRGGQDHDNMGPGIFTGFIAKRIETLVEKGKRNEAWVKRLEERGVTIIEVPDGDPDHTDRKEASDGQRDRPKGPARYGRAQPRGF